MLNNVAASNSALHPNHAKSLTNLSVLGASSLSRRVIQSSYVGAPLVEISPLDAAVVREEAVYFALHVGGLGPDPAATGEKLDLLAELAEEHVRPVVVRFAIGVELVCLVDAVDGLLDVPETCGWWSVRVRWALTLRFGERLAYCSSDVFWPRPPNSP